MFKKLLSKLVDHLVFDSSFEYGGYVDYPDVGRIYDKDVYYFIKMHSRLIDRINPKKMTEMSLLGQTILMGVFPEINPNDTTWQFYGKRSLHDPKD